MAPDEFGRGARSCGLRGQGVLLRNAFTHGTKLYADIITGRGERFPQLDGALGIRKGHYSLCSLEGTHFEVVSPGNPAAMTWGLDARRRLVSALTRSGEENVLYIAGPGEIQRTLKRNVK